MKQTSVFVAIAVLFLAFSPAAVAQVITGSITGTVSDETGAVLPGVEITVQNQDTGISRTVISNDEGSYRAPSLTVGPYEVRGELAGFQTTVRSGISLTVGRIAVVDITLQIGEITEQVFVTGEAPLVETTSASVAELVDENKIRDLPLNGRDFIQLAILQPGVIQSISAPRSQIGNEGVKIVIGGARHTQNSVLLDGTDMRNELAAAGSASGSSLGVETIREYQVITGVFSAEYGRFTGGVINAVSKSGTNELHGSVFEFHRNSALDARNFFDPAGKPPAFKRNQFGFTLGGPIVPDKTFIFGSYEGFRERLLTTRLSEVPNDMARLGLVPRSRGRCPLGSPTDPGTGLCDVGVDPAVQPYLDLYPIANGADNGDGTAMHVFPAQNDSNQDYFMVRLDHQFSDNDSFFVRYTFDDGDRILIPRLPDYGRDSVYRNQFTTLEWKRIISPNLINSLRFGYTRTKHDVTPIDTSGAPTSLWFVPETRTNAVFGEIDVDGQIVDLGPEHNQFKTNVFNNFQTSDHIVYTRGRHALKFGVDWQRFQFNFVNWARASGVFEFGGLPEFLSNAPHSSDGFANEFATIGMRQSVFGFYVQDDFTALPNLTLNLGLRYEFITEPWEVGTTEGGIEGRIGNMTSSLDPEVRLGNNYFENPSLKNFSPRIGLAWDPFGDGKSSVRAGFGVFFDQVVTNYYAAPIQLSPPNIRYVVQCPESVVLTSPNCPSFPNEFFLLPPQDQIKQSPWIIFDPNQPYLMQWSFNLQRELFPSGVFQIGYNGSKGTNLGRFVDSNTANGTRLADGTWTFPIGEEPVGRNPNFVNMNTTVWDANSFYHAMRLSFNKRFSNRYQFQVSYNWSRLIDEGSGTNFADRGGSGDQIWTTFVDDRKFDRGLSGNNVSHQFTANYTWDLPGDNLSGVAGAILGHWQVGGIANVSSGEQLTVLITFDHANYGGGTTVQRPDPVPGANPLIGDTPNGYLDRSAFFVRDSDPSTPGVQGGQFGSLGRGTFTGPTRSFFDFSLIKEVSLGADSSRNLQFRAEFFNITNKANFGRMGTRAFFNTTGRGPGSFGNFRNTVTTSRQIQFALKISF